MEEKNELNDIILKNGGSASSNKKIILAIATLGVILIIVVVLMNTLNSSGTSNLPQAVLPPEPKTPTQTIQKDEPLFEEIVVEEENTQNNDDSLNKIAQRLKQESQKDEVIVVEEEVVKKAVAKPTPKKVVKKAPVKKASKKTTSKTVYKTFFIQVGSFSKYEPNKKFLKSITDRGFSYKYHKVTKGSKTLNKVLVGPFTDEIEARTALRTLRSSVEPGAFLIKYK